MASVLLYSILACVLLYGIPTIAFNHDVVKHPHHRHAEGHHHHHSRHGHKGLAARDSNSTATNATASDAPASNSTASNSTASNATVNSTTDSTPTTNASLCLSSSEQELITFMKWLNNTKDLRLLYELAPPSVKSQYSGVSVTNSGNVTILNGTVSIALDALYHEYAEYKIIEYYARVFGVLFWTPGFLASEYGANIAKIILQAFIGGRNSTGNFVDNIDNVVSINSSWPNINLTNWENWLLPSKIVNNVQHVEHAIEGGITNFVHNVTNFLGLKKHA
ncbi:uncharacterized protein [Euwallacea similis]|uniref:uncharacterized protein n=1 Tax=Euwallacea similis TaxID=1736056 RepID=UPI00344C5BB0